MLKLVVKNEFKPERKDEAVALFCELVDETRKEDGCISYELFKSVADENTYSVIETWDSPEAQAAHMQSDHCKILLPKIMECIEGKPDVGVYSLVK